MKKLVINVFLSVFSVVVTFFIIEVGARVYKNEFSVHNFLEINRDLLRSAYPSEFDKELGWIPKEGNHPENLWATRVAILNYGIRSNGSIEHIEAAETIWAVGDSFTFGDQVSDNETWPALLEALSKKRVINGGVFGYGIDQSYLRMQALASKYQPDYIIFSFIPDDIYRCELSERTSVPKPYFDLSENGDLVLRKEHIPSRIPSESSLDIFRKVLGYSFFAHKLASRAVPEYWLQGSWRSTKVHSKGDQVTCRIFEQLNHYARETAVKIYILIQDTENGFEKDSSVVDEVITCIDKDVISLVDLRTSLARLKKHDLKKYERLFQDHMTREGNEFVASKLLEVISKR